MIGGCGYGGSDGPSPAPSSPRSWWPGASSTAWCTCRFLPAPRVAVWEAASDVPCRSRSRHAPPACAQPCPRGVRPGGPAGKQAPSGCEARDQPCACMLSVSQFSNNLGTPGVTVPADEGTAAIASPPDTAEKARAVQPRPSHLLHSSAAPGAPPRPALPLLLRDSLHSHRGRRLGLLETPQESPPVIMLRALRHGNADRECHDHDRSADGSDSFGERLEHFPKIRR